MATWYGQTPVTWEVTRTTTELPGGRYVTGPPSFEVPLVPAFPQAPLDWLLGEVELTCRRGRAA